MYQMLLNLWVARRLTEAQVEAAVAKGWITQDQADLILATPQNAAA